jgi:DNA-binding SARP family transcriptional activator
MTRLRLRLLGSFQAFLDDQAVSGFESNKVRALLAYLAVESEQPHRRESLAGLLWPDMPDRGALSNLRYALSDLRHVLGDRQADPPYLLVTRDAIGVNPQSGLWLDTAQLLEAVAAQQAEAAGRSPNGSRARLAEALDLYVGPFLDGFSVSGSGPFEEWALFKREQIGRQAVWALHELTADCEAAGDYSGACRHARRQIALEPWSEEAHRQLMRSLALSGQRNAALRQYAVCRRLLMRELGVEPAEETAELYREIRFGQVAARPVVAQVALDASGPGAAGDVRDDPPSMPAELDATPGTTDARSHAAVEAAPTVAAVLVEEGDGEAARKLWRLKMGLAGAVLWALAVTLAGLLHILSGQ